MVVKKLFDRPYQGLLGEENIHRFVLRQKIMVAPRPAGVLPDTPVRSIVEYITSFYDAALPRLTAPCGTRLAVCLYRPIRRSEKCANHCQYPEAQRMPQSALDGQFMKTVNPQKLRPERRKHPERVFNVKGAAGIDGTDEQRNDQLTLPARHFYADVGARFRRWMQRGRGQQALVYRRRWRAERIGQQLPVFLNMKPINKEPLVDPDIIQVLSQAGLMIKSFRKSRMQILAGERLRILAGTVLCFFPAADIQYQAPVIDRLPAADERRMATEDNEIPVPALFYLPEPGTLSFVPGRRGVVRVKAISQHFSQVMGALPAFPGYGEPRGDDHQQGNE